MEDRNAPAATSAKIRQLRIPRHIGIIPDGNRRWAVDRGMAKEDGYRHGVPPGLQLYETLLSYTISEATIYGFTKDNNKRPSHQRLAFAAACVDVVDQLSRLDANLLVIGNTRSKAFPSELLPYANQRVSFGAGRINLNFLVNYDWEWDLRTAQETGSLASQDISRVDLIVRWGGRCRLSGFLPVQSVYADIFVLDEFWPDFHPEHVQRALRWYAGCDTTLGG